MEFILDLPRTDITESAAREKFLSIKGFDSSNPKCFYDISKVELRPKTHSATLFYQERKNPDYVQPEYQDDEGR
ncbi:hypothetical protein F0169_05800 [Pseudomonas sp. MAFF 212408]|uniref:CYTH domain-containing protein n=1 Tax=Pseudomonas kitaguniensis TaxID=2607908 RepID=A0A5N7KHG8_9PSED|nr:hypothetical protein [Pseudomonas kitaguniensis]MPR01634.1 hypothetical protein [Pseudomonas kitaguniensis]